MMLSNSKGLRYKVNKANKTTDGQTGESLFVFHLTDPSTGKKFELPAMSKESLERLGYKLIK